MVGIYDRKTLWITGVVAWALIPIGVLTGRFVLTALVGALVVATTEVFIATVRGVGGTVRETDTAHVQADDAGGPAGGVSALHVALSGGAASSAGRRLVRLRHLAVGAASIVAVSVCVIAFYTSSTDVLGVLIACVAAAAVLVSIGPFVVQRRARIMVEETIDSLPPELQAKFADEWREEFATMASGPITATRFVRDVRSRAANIRGESVPVRGGDGADSHQRRSDSEPRLDRPNVSRWLVIAMTWMERHPRRFLGFGVVFAVACGLVAATQVIR